MRSIKPTDSLVAILAFGREIILLFSFPPSFPFSVRIRLGFPDQTSAFPPPLTKFPPLFRGHGWKHRCGTPAAIRYCNEILTGRPTFTWQIESSEYVKSFFFLKKKPFWLEIFFGIFRKTLHTELCLSLCLNVSESELFPIVCRSHPFSHSFGAAFLSCLGLNFSVFLLQWYRRSVSSFRRTNRAPATPCTPDRRPLAARSHPTTWSAPAC